MVNISGFYEAIGNIKKNRPLIHHMTNYVVANMTANFTLAMKASPIMATSIDEVAEITKFADVLVLNIGTISVEQFEAMKVAAKIMKRRNKKIVLDPVGVGISKLRCNVVEYFIKEHIVDVVKGNYSEIMTLSGLSAMSKGVDSLEGDIALVNNALGQLSKKYNSVFAATGEVDIVNNGIEKQELKGGNIIMQYITGTGCLATAAVGVFLSVADPFNATVYGLYLLKKIANEIKAEGPAEFYSKFIDKIYKMF